MQATSLPVEFSSEIESERIAWERRYYRENFDVILTELGMALNAALNIDRPVSFWRLLVGPWLYSFIPFVLAEMRSNIDRGSKVPQRHVSADFDDFSARTFLTASAELVWADCRRRPVLLEAEQVDHLLEQRRSKGWRRRLARLMKRMHWHAQGIVPGRAQVVVRDGYFSDRTTFAIWWQSGGRVIFDRREYDWSPERQPVDWDLREKLGSQLQLSLPEPGATLRRLIPLHLPKSYLEGFEALGALADRYYRPSAKVFFTCNAHWHDEVFKFETARASERGGKLLAGQHGANYGIVQDLLGEELERRNATKFCTWGWAEDERTVPLPAPRLLVAGDRRGEADEILFTSTTTTINGGVNEPYTGTTFSDYLALQIRFLNALPVAVRSHLRFRTLADWDREFWAPLAAFPEIRLENAYDAEAPFLTRLASCRLFICDHIGTTYAQALSANKPTLLFWDPAVMRIRPSAAPYFEAFRACGILHYDPEEAAREAVRAHADIDEWWAAADKQAAVKAFQGRFLLTGENASQTWAKFLVDEI